MEKHLTIEGSFLHKMATMASDIFKIPSFVYIRNSCFLKVCISSFQVQVNEIFFKYLWMVHFSVIVKRRVRLEEIFHLMLSGPTTII